MDTHERYQAFLRKHQRPTQHHPVVSQRKQRKTTLISAALTVCVLLLFVIMVLILFRQTNPPAKPQEKSITKVVNPVKDASPKTFGVSYELASNQHIVTFTINHAADIVHITYALTYLTTGDMRKGVVGDLTVSASQPSVTSPAIPFGSCKDTDCTYDTDIHQPQLILTITKTSGKKFQVTEPVKL